MKKQHSILLMLVAIMGIIISSCEKKTEELSSVPQSTGTTGHRLKSVPANPNNKVAYYAFDATPQGGQGKLRLTDFTDNANIIVLFEGTIFELGDSAHYGSSSNYIVTINGGPYKYYKQIIDDIHTLRARGIKVLMNVDDASSWQTTTPFTDYTGTGKTYTEYATLVNQMAQAVPFDGIALDVEHFSGAANQNWINLVREFGKYFGPKSSNPDNTIYTAAIYSGAAAGDAIGKNTTTAAYFNFVEDMGYFQDNTTRFNQYANVIGAGKVMDGMSYDYNSQADAIAHVNWMKSVGGAGVMVFAGNVNKPYTDAIFAAVTPTVPGAASNPSPANGATGVITTTSLSWTAGSGATTHNVYFGTSNPPVSIGSQTATSYSPGTLTANTTYYWRIDEVNSVGTTTGTVWSFTTGSNTGGTSVSLTSLFNVSYGIVTDGSTFGSTSGLDGQGYGYSSALLGSSITWNSTTFNRGPVNASDAISGSGQTISLNSGNYSYLRMLATGVGGSQASQSFRVNYSDGTYSTFTQGISDWCTPQSYSGESKAVTMSYRNKYNGTKQSLTCNLYGYSFSLTNTKTVSSIKLPSNSKVRVLAITLVP